MIDFHCHVDLYPDPAAVVAECERAGVHVLSVTTTPSAWHGTLALAPASKYIRTALGLHPELAHERHGELALFDRLLPETKYVGEIGLDHSRGTETHWPVHRACYRTFSMPAKTLVAESCHSTAARQRLSVLDQLEAFRVRGNRSFTGSQVELRSCSAPSLWAAGSVSDRPC